ncbi:MAG TPA: hypothetical protein VJL29_08350 [Thermoguttaceae bacterium]|nr:hypothetical protein [Thermoguttaceae bacterium]
MNKPSGWLQAVGIAAIVLGGMGLLSGLSGLAKIAVGPTWQIKFRQQPGFGTTAEQADVQRDMQKEVRKIADRWLPVTGPLVVVDVLVSICLIVGGIGTLRLRPVGRSTLYGVFLAAIVLELAQLGPTIALQHGIASITTDYMSRMMEASAPKGQEMPREMTTMVSSFTKVGIILAIGFTVLMKAIEVGFYVFGVTYLGRANVRAQFAEPLTAELIE